VSDGPLIDQVFCQFQWQGDQLGRVRMTGEPVRCAIREPNPDERQEDAQRCFSCEPEASCSAPTSAIAVRSAPTTTDGGPRALCFGTICLGICLLLAGWMSLRGLVRPRGVREALPHAANACARNGGSLRRGYRLKRIAEFRPGDEVLSWNPETGRVEKRRVVRTVRRVSDHLRVLTFADRRGHQQTIKTTDEHPFWLAEERRFVPAGELEVGQKFRSPSGDLLWLVSTRRELHPEGVPVYNLEVEGVHTYFVSPIGSHAAPILAHNANECFTAARMTPDQQALKELVDEATHGGRRPLSVEEAETILDWAEEVNYPGWRAGPGDVAGDHWIGPHIHLTGAGRPGGHVPVDIGVLPRGTPSSAP